jgi:hypothetical protein
MGQEAADCKNTRISEMVFERRTRLPPPRMTLNTGNDIPPLKTTASNENDVLNTTHSTENDTEP